MPIYSGQDVLVKYTALDKTTKQPIKNLQVSIVKILDKSGNNVLENSIPMQWSEEHNAYVAVYSIPQEYFGVLKFYIEARGLAKDVEAKTIYVRR